MPEEEEQVSAIEDETVGEDSKEEEFDKERAMRTISNLRESEKLAKRQKKELEEAKKKLEEYDLSGKSELEKLQVRAEVAEKKIREALAAAKYLGR